MTFKSVLDIDCGIRYLYDTLDIMSPCGRKMLLTGEMMVHSHEIVAYYSRLNEIYHKNCDGIAHKLMCIKDIDNTLCRLNDGAVLDDIELFEIKYLSIISDEIRQMLCNLGITAVELPVLSDVVALLDPDQLNIPSFYIYDSYHEALKEVRRLIRGLQGSDVELNEAQRGELAVLMQRNADIELEVRTRLSAQLRGRSQSLQLALGNLSLLDILIAKSVQIKKMQLCFPEVVTQGSTSYHQMFNPVVKDHLAQQGKAFMPVDITIESEPVTIIGANMGGKSVVIKSLAMNQLLMQFGFGIAAQRCQIKPVDEVVLCIGDEQSMVKGVSSFAGEILAIDAAIKKIKAGNRLLALIDEPARTTNPIEGTALVEGLLDVVGNSGGGFVLTTHYNIENSSVKRYKVKGLKDGVMDYTLEETHSGDVPCEAIAIAESLGIDAQWIECTKTKLNNRQ